jgi:C-terminal processing protease CtpA/Prc
MRKIKVVLLVCFIAFSAISCFEDRDDNLIAASEINDFVWKAMNAVYLYKADVPDLANNRFSTNEDYAQYLNSFSRPEDLFESLVFLPETVDRFSVIIDNYIEFQQSQQGTSLSNGLDFRFYLHPGSTTRVFGIIRLVANGSPADMVGLQRGQIFDAIDGVDLNTSNFASLISQDSYTLNFADYNNNGTDTIDDDTIVPNNNSETLTKIVFTENPVYETEVVTVDNITIGYLAYNAFNANFNNELNQAFAIFQNNNIDELVIDLRYNSGGSVQTAAYLGSMITGQFTNQVYSKLVYNQEQAQNNRDFLFTNSIINGPSINSLNLNKVYVLTTSRYTASASKLVINSLKPYINVVQIGEPTVGKTQASITVYDSPNLSFNEVNPNHTYALQPLVANSINVNDLAVPSSGLVPNIVLSETPRNFGTLGDPNEPLFQAAIRDITGSGRLSPTPNDVFKDLKPATPIRVLSTLND